MTYRRTALLAAALILALPVALPASAQRETRERHIYASVVDHDGTPATGLGVKDFAIREDNITREILRVAPAADPLEIALLVDDSQAASSMVQVLRSSLHGFVAALLAANSDTQISMVTFGDRPTTRVPYTSNAPRLNDGIDHLFGQAGAGAYLLDAIVDSSQALKKTLARRKVIVAFDVEGGQEFSNVGEDRVREVLKGAGVALWPVVLQRKGEDTSAEERSRTIVLGDVTTNSGGAREIVLSSVSLELAFKHVAAALTSEYDIAYGRPDSLVPPSRIEVKVTRPGLRISAPAWTGQ